MGREGQANDLTRVASAGGFESCPTTPQLAHRKQTKKHRAHALHPAPQPPARSEAGTTEVQGSWCPELPIDIVLVQIFNFMLGSRLTALLFSRITAAHANFVLLHLKPPPFTNRTVLPFIAYYDFQAQHYSARAWKIPVFVTSDADMGKSPIIPPVSSPGLLGLQLAPIHGVDPISDFMPFRRFANVRSFESD